MKIVYTAIWYDPGKVKANAIKAGWDPNRDDGFLDYYFPEEDPNGHDERNFSDLESAVAFLKKLLNDGKDFWGQARIDKFEVGGKRCEYCTCRGWNRVHTYVVEPDGVVEDHTEDNCWSDD